MPNHKENINTSEQEEPISLDELREILASKGLDIKELAREAKAIKTEKRILTATSTTTSIAHRKTGPVFELALVNYPDFVIRRSTAKTEKLMVFMVSQDSYYIKTVKNGIEYRIPLTREDYGSFTSSMDTITMPEEFWIREIKSGMQFFDALNEVLRSNSLRKAIIEKYFRIATNRSYTDGYGFTRAYEAEMYTAIPSLIKAFPDKDLYDNWEFYRDLAGLYGIENTKDFIEEASRSLINDEFPGFNMYSWHDEERDDSKVAMLRKYHIEYKAFKQYILYDTVRMGLADDLLEFKDLWKDTLNMQMNIYGKIKNKYPKHLQEMHDQLAYKERIMEKQINKEKFEARVQDATRFEAEINKYTFIAPKQPQDFYDEATAMGNCLAGYIDHYANGEDYIFFMRNKTTPETSLVTIELDLEGQLRQAYQAHNRTITEEQRITINKWLETIVNPLLSPNAA